MGFSSDYLSELHAARLLISAFIAMSVILVNSYNSKLVSFITVPKRVPVVDSMEDLAERYPISLIAQKFSASELVLFGAEQGVYKKLGDRIRNKPEQFVDTQDEGIDKVLTEKHGYFGLSLRTPALQALTSLLSCRYLTVAAMSSLEKMMLKSRLPPRPPGPSRAQMSLAMKRKKDYTPVHWSRYFDGSRDVSINEGQDIFHCYLKGDSGPLLVVLHGGGFSGLTWALFTAHITELIHCQVMAIDLRGHGETKTSNEKDLSAARQAEDVIGVLRALYGDDLPPIVLMGHSMGGAVAVHVATTEEIASLVGLVVIDVVEGTAMEALTSMQSFLRSRPRSFATLEQAIEWSVRSGQIRNVDSARVSFPSQLKSTSTGQSATKFVLPEQIETMEEERSILPVRGDQIAEEDESATSTDDDVVPAFKSFKSPETVPLAESFTWRIDLTETEEHWPGWFQGLSQNFLNVETPRLLLLAGVDRLDKDLMVGQMQGKFQMQVLPQCGHAVHEDVPERVAEVVAAFLVRHRTTSAKDPNFDVPVPRIP
nr:EOG090X07NZ [Lepidurus arcticus]